MDEKYEKAIDEQIRRAQQEGQFDNLPGKGRPLDLHDNPYEDPAWRTAFRILRNSGYTLPWIETRQGIERDLQAARLALQHSWDWYHSPAAAGLTPAGREQEWAQARTRFETALLDLNRRIRSYNLQVPSAQFKLKPLQLEREIAVLTPPD